MVSLIVGLMVPEGQLRSQLVACLYPLPIRVFFEPCAPLDWDEFLARQARLRTDVLIVDVGRNVTVLEEMASRLRTLPGGPHWLAVHTMADPDLIPWVRSLGGEDFLAPPFEGELPALLTRIAERRAQQRRRDGFTGQVLGVAGAKGGAGATTLACHLAVALREVAQAPVLLADLDWRDDTLGFLMKSRTPYSLLDVARHGDRVAPGYWSTLVSQHGGVDVLPAPPLPLAEALSDRLPVAIRLARDRYGWVVLDLGSGCGIQPRGVLAELDVLCLVATPDAVGLYAARRALQWLESAGVNRGRLRLIWNRFHETMTESEQLRGWLGLAADEQLPESDLAGEVARSGRSPSLRGAYGRACRRLARRFVGQPVEAEGRPAGRFLLRLALRHRLPRLATRS